MTPSAHRLSGKDRERSARKLAGFLEWAKAVPQMAPYAKTPASLTAIAQHYGIPTTCLDLTESPKIATLFAKRIDDPDADPMKAVIYCFDEAELQTLSSARLVRINVANLWRLEAQHGLFLEFLDESLAEQLRDIAVRIHFPAEQITEEEHALLYPLRKSSLEIILDQWFYRHEVETVMEHFSSPTKRVLIKRRSYPGAFVWRQIPELSPQWVGEHAEWFVPDVEPISVLSSRKIVSVPASQGLDLASAVAHVRQAIASSIFASSHTNELVTFAVDGDLASYPLLSSAARLLNMVWDGIRTLPYTTDEQVECMSLTAALVTSRATGLSDLDNWQGKLWGDTEMIEVAPIGGHIEAGIVARSRLGEACTSSHIGNLAKPFRRTARKCRRDLMTYVVDPWILFDFEPFKHIFVEQFIPSAVDAYWEEDITQSNGQLECMWSIPFNPALLGYVTNVDFRFESPLAFESDLDRIVYVTSEMTESDIEEAFVYCLPHVLETGRPYQVKFPGYERDSREIWQIPKAIEQCRQIVDVSGISVLEVSTLMRDPAISRDLFDNPGLGAFEVWLIARGQMDQVHGQPIARMQALFRDFLDVLGQANADIEARTERRLRASEFFQA